MDHMENQSQDELQPERLLIEINGEERWVNAYTLGNAAKKVGRSYKGFQGIVERNKVQLWKPQIGKGTYILEEDLKNLMRALPIKD